MNSNNLNNILNDILGMFNYEPSEESKLNNVKNYLELVNESNKNLHLYLKSDENRDFYRTEACKYLNKIVSSVDFKEYLLLDSNPRIPKKVYIESYFTLGTLLKNIVEEWVQYKREELLKNNANRKEQIPLELTKFEHRIFNKSIECFVNILRVDFENNDAIQQLVSIYTQLTFFNQGDLRKSIEYLSAALLIAADNSTVHYNLGFIYQRLNLIEQSLIHYNISNRVLLLEKEIKEPSQESIRLIINNYNGISSLYRNLKMWPQSLHYSLKAKELAPFDTDINNQLGVIYTELRRTDLAEECYKTAIKYYKSSFISTDPDFLLCEIYLNYGSMNAYNGDNNKSIECYNQALKICPLAIAAFQNKLLNLNYIFDQLPDDNKLYITDQHKIINRLYNPLKTEPNAKVFSYTTVNQNKDKINIGIVSGDFIDHPVSYFVSTLLKKFDSDKFNITCYSECIINTDIFNNKLKFKLIKNMSAHQASQLINDDNIDILLDLSGHTSHNRLDVFSLKPAPIQITYIGYPFTTGLKEMDYRITDSICDGDLSVSQDFYTEKLICLKNCFLCYDPTPINEYEIPKIKECPKIKNGEYLTIGCYNRVNKITEPVVQQFNELLLKNNFVKFIFKTKALINKNIKEIFIKKFDESVRDRIVILDCTLTHEEHLETYNEVDIAIDTFPYSGTTTTCESLYMGTPVFSMYDSTYYFHPANVSCSILKNSNMEEFVVNSFEELNLKINILQNQNGTFWQTFKQNIRNKFLTGKVCNKNEYIKNIQELFVELYNKNLTTQN